MQQTATEALLSSLRRLQRSSEYSDLKIFCGDDVFKVHKAVICPRSKYFATSCRWGKDGQTKDEIILEDDDPRIVRLMIDYFYQLNYDDLDHQTSTVDDLPTVSSPNSPVAEKILHFEGLKSEDAALIEHDQYPSFDIESDHEPIDAPAEVPEPPVLSKADFSWSSSIKSRKDNKKKKGSIQRHLKNNCEDVNTSRLSTDTRIYALADKYAIEDLKMLAKTKFVEALSEDWESKSFAHAAELIFDTPPKSDRGLRTVVIETLNQHRSLLDYQEI